MFYYQIFGNLGSLSPIYVVIKLVLDRLDNWQIGHKKILDYSNRNSRIASFGQTTTKITGKIFQARLLKDANLAPETWIVLDGRLISLSNDKNSTEAKNPTDKNTTEVTKFFLKPDNSSGGKGIQILSSINQYKKFAGNQNYVLQRGVKNLLLHNGHKFDLRVWVHMVYKKHGQYQAWMHLNGGYLRIAQPLYSSESQDIGVNITNNAWHKKTPTIGDFYITDLWQTQEFYQKTFSKIEALAKQLLIHLRPYWKKPISYSGFEVIGLDILIDQNYQLHLLEFNRHLGFPLKRQADRNYNQLVRESVLQVTQEFIQDFVEPLLENKSYHPRDLWRPILTF